MTAEVAKHGHGAGVSRRRVLAGAAWAAPAVVVAAAAPAAASGSVDPGPPPDAPFTPVPGVSATAVPGQNKDADVTVTIQAPSSAPAGTSFDPGSRLEFTGAYGTMTVISVTASSDWVVTPAVGGSAATVTLRYEGDPIIAPSSTVLTVQVRLGNAVNNNSGNAANRTVTVRVYDASGNMLISRADPT